MKKHSSIPSVRRLQQQSVIKAMSSNEFGSMIITHLVPGYVLGDNMANNHLFSYDYKSIRAAIPL
jgi:hypothetical protein